MQGLQLELGLVRHKPPLAGEERDLKKKRSLPSWKPPPRNKNTGVEKRVASLLIINKVKGLKTICTFIFSTKVNWCHGDWTSYISRNHIIKFLIGKGFYVIFFLTVWYANEVNISNVYVNPFKFSELYLWFYKYVHVQIEDFCLMLSVLSEEWIL